MGDPVSCDLSWPTLPASGYSTRSHAQRGNAVFDALRRELRWTLSGTETGFEDPWTLGRRRASRTAFTRRAWERAGGLPLPLRQELARVEQAPLNVFERFAAVLHLSDVFKADLHFAVGRLAGQRPQVELAQRIAVILLLAEDAGQGRAAV